MSVRWPFTAPMLECIGAFLSVGLCIVWSSAFRWSDRVQALVRQGCQGDLPDRHQRRERASRVLSNRRGSRSQLESPMARASPSPPKLMARFPTGTSFSSTPTAATPWTSQPIFSLARKRVLIMATPAFRGETRTDRFRGHLEPIPRAGFDCPTKRHRRDRSPCNLFGFSPL